METTLLDDEASGASFTDFMASVDAIVMGRVAFDRKSFFLERKCTHMEMCHSLPGPDKPQTMSKFLVIAQGNYRINYLRYRDSNYCSAETLAWFEGSSNTVRLVTVHERRPKIICANLKSANYN